MTLKRLSGSEGRMPALSSYLFPVLDDELNPKELQQQTQNFTRFVNQHMKTVAKEAGITEEVTTYWARHTFTPPP